MPSIKSANPDARKVDAPSLDTGYQHGLSTGQSYVPMIFQVTSPFNNRLSLLPHALVLHVNPKSLSITHTKRVERFQTYGGFVEQHWPDALGEISADATTGAFMNIYTGLTSVLRQKTIAWDRYQDLLDLYHHNGCIYNPNGQIVLKGNVMMIYDRSTYLGYFTTFSDEETDQTPYSFNLSWSFKIEREVSKIPFSINSSTNYSNPFG